MSRYGTLTKYFLKSALGEMFNSSKIKASVSAVLMISVILLISLPFAGGVVAMYPTLKLINQEGMIIATLLNAGMLMIFFFGIYTILNIFYFSSDVEQLLPMPFKPREIIFSKFIAVYINMLMYSFILILPLIAYGVLSKASIIYYLYSIIIVFLVPILPIVVASIICMVLMRFTNMTKHKDGFKMLASCISLIAIIIFNVFMQDSGNEGDKLTDLLREGDNSLIGKVNGYIILNKFFNIALLHTNELKGFLYLFLGIILCLCIYGIFYIIGGKIYFKGIIGGTETYSKGHKILEKKNPNDLLKTKSTMYALVIKDIKILLRTPQFFINSVAVLFYLPAILLITAVSDGGIIEIRNLINSIPSNSIILAVAFIIVAITISSGGAGLYALSREGKDFEVSKYIPVSFETHLKSKIVSSLIVNELMALIILGFMIYLRLEIAIMILSTIVVIVTIAFVTIIGLFIDFKSPKLDWDDEKALMKNNISPLIIMLIMVLMGIGILILSFFVSYIVLFLLIIFVDVFCFWFIYNRLLVLADKIYNNY